MRPQHTHTRFGVWLGLSACVLVLAASPIVSAASPASLTVNVPQTVANSAEFTIKASGNAGEFNRVGVKAYRGTNCTALAGELAGHVLHSTTVAEGKPFDLSWSFIAAHPGEHMACVYLYSASKPNATAQLERTRIYTVTGG